MKSRTISCKHLRQILPLLGGTCEAIGQSHQHVNVTTVVRSMATQSSGPTMASTKDFKSSKSLALLGLSVAGAGWVGYEMLRTSNQQVAQCSSPHPGAGIFRKDLPTFTKQEVSKHRTKDSGIWVTYKDGVYDVTQWADIHPGGAQRLMLAAGGAIDPFWAMYAQHNTDQVKEILEEYRIGNLEGGATPVGDPYANEPKDRHPSLAVRSRTPLNAETPMELLAESLITPNDLFYIRNHLPVPDIDAKEYKLEIGGEGVKSVKLSLEDLKTKFKKHTVVATVQCAGNRRKDLMEAPDSKEIKGLEWHGAAIGTASWSGVLLRDVLKAAGLDSEDASISHVQFEGADKDISGAIYGASIPVWKALDPRGDVLLAYEMNGQPLTRDHGHPLRVIVPGVGGCRSVKWLTKIITSSQESLSFWQQNDYKTFSPNVDWDTVDWSSSPAIQNLPVTSAITEPPPGTKIEREDEEELTVKVKGYAWSGGGNGIIRVDVSADGGKTWQDAHLHRVKQESGRSWAWTLWECDVALPKAHQGPIDIVAKATDESCNTQPERAEGVWNLRGVACNIWPKVTVEVV